MSSRVKINEKYGVLEMTLEKRENHGWETICSTNNHNVIYEYFRLIKDKIVEIVFYDNTTNITLNNSIGLQIPNNINNNNLKIFEPLHEGIADFNQQKKKRSRKRGSLRISIFSVALLLSIGMHELKRDISSSFIKSIEVMETLNNLERVNEKTNTEENVFYPKTGLNIEEENIRLFNYITDKKFGEANYRTYLPSFGANRNDNKYLSVVENYGHLTKKYAEISGIDVELLNCVLAQERGIHSSTIDEGGAIGIAQIQVNQHLGSTLTLYNVITGEKYEVVVTMKLLESVEGNIFTCASLLQSAKIKYDGNTFLMLQAYNYGEGAMDTVISRSGYTLEEINGKYRDLSWMDEIYKYSNEKGGYGDKVYIDNVFSRYPFDELTVIDNDNPITINITDIEKTKRMVF